MRTRPRFEQAHEPITAEIKTAFPDREEFVPVYCAYREVSAEQAGKLYDLLVSEPEWRGAIGEWLGHMQEIRNA